MRHQDMRILIKDVLTEANLYSRDAEELLILTMAAESLGGHYLFQQNGPARGFFQMEPATERDILNNFIKFKTNLRLALANIIAWEGDKWAYLEVQPLVRNLAYQILMARIHYLRKPGSIPNEHDVEGLAHYWKEHYNTRLGKGTVEGAIKKYKEYVS